MNLWFGIVTNIVVLFIGIIIGLVIGNDYESEADKQIIDLKKEILEDKTGIIVEMKYADGTQATYKYDPREEVK